MFFFLFRIDSNQNSQLMNVSKRKSIVKECLDLSLDDRFEQFDKNKEEQWYWWEVYWWLIWLENSSCRNCRSITNKPMVEVHQLLQQERKLNSHTKIKSIEIHSIFQIYVLLQIQWEVVLYQWRDPSVDCYWLIHSIGYHWELDQSKR